jgi:aminoglycoside 3-N-acetyltransferase
MVEDGALPTTSMREPLLLLIEVMSRSLYWRIPVLRRLRERRTRATGQPIQRVKLQSLANRLDEMGLSRREVTMLHTGLSGVRISCEDGSEQVEALTVADSVLDTVLGAIGTTGTLVMPTHVHYPRPTGEAKVPVYDPRRSPCSVGLANELFWRRKGVKRSIFPYNSVAASGPLANALLEDHLSDKMPSAHGADSPYFRICQKDGLILSLGIRLKDCLTIAHVVEETRPDWPIRDFFEERTYDVRQGPEVRRWTIRQRRAKYAELCYCRRKMARDLVRNGIIHEGRIDDLKCDWANASEIFEFFTEQTNRSPYPYYALWQI